MSLIAMLVRRLRMLLGTAGVFLALGVITFAVLLRGGAMRLGGIFVMLGSLVVLVFCHLRFLCFSSQIPKIPQTPIGSLFEKECPRAYLAE
jgi:hypothetical protein